MVLASHRSTSVRRSAQQPPPREAPAKTKRAVSLLVCRLASSTGRMGSADCETVRQQRVAAALAHGAGYRYFRHLLSGELVQQVVTGPRSQAQAGASVPSAAGDFGVEGGRCLPVATIRPVD